MRIFQFFHIGNADGTWTVDLPAAEVPPEMPEPVLGINFARNGRLCRIPLLVGNTMSVLMCMCVI